MSTHCLGGAVLMNTHNLCFEQKYEKNQNFLSEIFHFLVVKFSVYFNRHVFLMCFLLFYYQNKKIQSTPVISNSKGLNETLRDIRTSTYQS